MSFIGKILQPAKKQVTNTVHGVESLMGRGPAANSMAMRSQGGQATKLAAKMAYQSSPLGAYMQFATNPNIQNLLMAGMSFTPGGATAGIALNPGGLRRALNLPMDLHGIQQAKALNAIADKQVVPFARDIRHVFDKVLQDPTKGVVNGGHYLIKPQTDFPNFVADRFAMIQDPRTGTIFGGKGALHGELINYVRQHYPQFNVDDVHRWMQHEVYAPTDFGHGTDPVPARIMFDLGWAQGPRADTKAATISRAKLIQALAQHGVRQDEGLAKWLESRTAAARGDRPTPKQLKPRVQRPAVPHLDPSEFIRQLRNQGK